MLFLCDRARIRVEPGSVTGGGGVGGRQVKGIGNDGDCKLIE